MIFAWSKAIKLGATNSYVWLGTSVNQEKGLLVYNDATSSGWTKNCIFVVLLVIFSSLSGLQMKMKHFKWSEERLTGYSTHISLQ